MKVLRGIMVVICQQVQTHKVLLFEISENCWGCSLYCSRDRIWSNRAENAYSSQLTEGWNELIFVSE